MAHKRRPDNLPTVQMVARVSPDVRGAVQAAAQRSGVTMAYYLEVFLQSSRDEHGELPLLPAADDEELPICIAA